MRELSKRAHSALLSAILINLDRFIYRKAWMNLFFDLSKVAIYSSQSEGKAIE